MERPVLAPIKCAAIRISLDGGYYILITGKRHWDCFTTAGNEGIECKGRDEQGFIDENGRFWNRKQALRIAEKFDQIKGEKHAPIDKLLSEDLY